jgi:hypothetical protein
MRGIKPEIWTDEKFVDLSPLARLLFVGMWHYACDNGHLDDKPKQIKMRVLPTDNVDPDALIEEMVTLEMVERRQDGLLIPKLREHQRIDDRYFTWCDRCAPDEIPEKSRERHAATTRGTRGDTAGARREPTLKEGRKVKEGEGEGSSARRAHGVSDDDPAFAAFWAAYPRKTAKGGARKAWGTMLKKRGHSDGILEAVQRYAQRVAGSDEKFIAHPATWLNQERWLDEESTQQPTLLDRPREVFQLPTPPAEIADNPAAYQQWVRDQRAAWDARRAGGDR